MTGRISSSTFMQYFNQLTELKTNYSQRKPPAEIKTNSCCECIIHCLMRHSCILHTVSRE